MLCDSATTTILFSEFEQSAASFAFGLVSLLSSLMAIGFGVGLIYVLGDVHGDTLQVNGSCLLTPRLADDARTGHCASLPKPLSLFVGDPTGAFSRLTSLTISNEDQLGMGWNKLCCFLRLHVYHWLGSSGQRTSPQSMWIGTVTRTVRTESSG